MIEESLRYDFEIKVGSLDKGKRSFQLILFVFRVLPGKAWQRYWGRLLGEYFNFLEFLNVVSCVAGQKFYIQNL